MTPYTKSSLFALLTSALSFGLVAGTDMDPQNHADNVEAGDTAFDGNPARVNDPEADKTHCAHCGKKKAAHDKKRQKDHDMSKWADKKTNHLQSWYNSLEDKAKEAGGEAETAWNELKEESADEWRELKKHAASLGDESAENWKESKKAFKSGYKDFKETLKDYEEKWFPDHKEDLKKKRHDEY